ncbi:MAG: DeoR/GlpR transcriptional regulator [Lentisphaerae bacterium]|nr:DeoR/GlpR transcriptional regulator [Lentisphaerota bacterium]
MLFFNIRFPAAGEMIFLKKNGKKSCVPAKVMLFYNTEKIKMYQRQRKILDILQKGRLSIRETARELGVTEMTLRRDLKSLEERKLILMVKGGAVLHPARYEPENDDPSDSSMDCKFAIGNALYERIMPANSIFISAGTTSLAFAKVIARRNHLPMTVITNSLPVASTLFRSCCKVILLGGELRTHSLDLTGPIAEKNLEEYQVDWLISGCDAALSDYGFYTSDVSVSNLEKRSLQIASKAAIITTSSKFGRRALTRFATLDDIDLLVTDEQLTADDEAVMIRSGVEIIKVALL